MCHPGSRIGKSLFKGRQVLEPYDIYPMAKQPLSCLTILMSVQGSSADSLHLHLLHGVPQEDTQATTKGLGSTSPSAQARA